MKPVSAILLGAGGRGMYTFGEHAVKYPEDLKFVAVAEPDAQRRERFARIHGIADNACFASWEELLARPQMAEACFICTLDTMHYKPALAALEKGYHLLLEKPMSPDPAECVAMGEAAKSCNRVVSVCHVLRYTPFFSKLKRLLDDGRIGQLVSIQHNENVAHWHQAHSFVRGNWRNSVESSPMIVQKCCHDMDIMLWLANADALAISSFGSLTHFTPENAPAGAPQRCQDGCPARDTCYYYAPSYYLDTKLPWMATIIDPNLPRREREAELHKSPYGRCVYHCDNDVVDHQVVNIEFANGVTAAFTMCAFTKECTRTIKLMGTKGEIRGAMELGEIEILEFGKEENAKIVLKQTEEGHGGGDVGIVKDFIRLVREGNVRDGLTAADKSVQSHLMAFAAERARLQRRVVKISEFYEASHE